MGVLKIIQREMDDVNAPSACYHLLYHNHGKYGKIMENHIFLYLLITVNRYIGAVTHQKDISSVSQPTGEPISASKVGRQT